MERRTNSVIKLIVSITEKDYVFLPDKFYLNDLQIPLFRHREEIVRIFDEAIKHFSVE